MKKKQKSSIVFLFTATQLENLDSGPSFWRVQIWNDCSGKPKKIYGRHPMFFAPCPVSTDSLFQRWQFTPSDVYLVLFNFIHMFNYILWHCYQFNFLCHKGKHCPQQEGVQSAGWFGPHNGFQKVERMNYTFCGMPYYLTTKGYCWGIAGCLGCMLGAPKSECLTLDSSNSWLPWAHAGGGHPHLSTWLWTAVITGTAHPNSGRHASPP